MANNKLKRETKPIGFRLEVSTADAISKAAKERGLTIQEYFLSQIQPNSELDTILKQEQLRMIEKSDNIDALAKKMQADAKNIQQNLGLSEREFEVAVNKALTTLLKKKTE